MRLFAAVWPSAEAAEHLAAALGRPPSPRWHLTLAFLGEVAVPPDLSAVRVEPFDVALGGAGTFSGGRVLWAGVRLGAEPLAELAVAVAGACAAAGVALEDRPYRPHLTVRRGRDLEPGPLVHYAGPAWTVDRFALLESRGGRYLAV